MRADRPVPVSPRRDAIDRGVAPHDVDVVLRSLAEPDRDMQESGAAEIELALPPGTTPSYRRNLAGAIWRAMLARAACGALALLISAPAVAAGYDPVTLTLEFADGHTEAVAGTSPTICAEALLALRAGHWRPVGEQPIAWRCGPGNQFAACSVFIAGFNAPPGCGGGR